LSKFIRFKKIDDLFYDKEIGNPIIVSTNQDTAILTHYFQFKMFDLIVGNYELHGLLKFEDDYNKMNKNFSILQQTYDNNKNLVEASRIVFDSFGEFQSSDYTASFNIDFIKKYDFIKLNEFDDRSHHFLAPPHGKNLFNVLQHHKNLGKEISSLFKEYKLQLVLDIDRNQIFVQKRKGNYVYQNDYFLIADTLQRYIFYLLAIETNKDSVLLFEEPEAHSFPPYIRDIALKIGNCKTNQFFITTHSPFVLNTIIEEVPQKDVAVFNVTYEKFQTKIEPLSDKEISDMLNYGNDIFFNLK
ncbi:MAG: ATP-binding protein, partial [Bacteroidia bacterium]|nr:ATP-binding protein [Bacteroidia bacterium]